MTRGKNALIASIFLLLFYAGIVGYILFKIVGKDAEANFYTGIVFTSIDIVSLLVLACIQVLKGTIRLGYRVPIYMYSGLHSIALLVLNIFGIPKISNIYFILCNLVLLFLFYIVIIPMIVKGYAKKEG